MFCFVLCVILCLWRYFKVYDTGDRQGLLEAYHDQVGQLNPKREPGKWQKCSHNKQCQCSQRLKNKAIVLPYIIAQQMQKKMFSVWPTCKTGQNIYEHFFFQLFSKKKPLRLSTVFHHVMELISLSCVTTTKNLLKSIIKYLTASLAVSLTKWMVPEIVFYQAIFSMCVNTGALMKERSGQR